VALIAADITGALELNDMGSINVVTSLLGYAPRDEACGVLMAVAKHLPDLVVMAGGLPQLALAVLLLSDTQQRAVVAFLHELRQFHAAGIARAQFVRPLLHMAGDLVGDVEHLRRVMEVVAAATKVDVTLTAKVLENETCKAVLARLQTHEDEAVKAAATAVQSML
jgi:hypothetical protein